MNFFKRMQQTVTLMAVLVVVALLAAPAAAYDIQQIYTRISATAGETLTTGDVVTIKDADGKAYKADADDSALRPAVGVVGKGAAAAAKVEIVTSGILKGWSSLSEGLPGYLSATAGAVTQTAPTAWQQQVAVAISTTQYLFRFQAAAANVPLKLTEDVTAANVLTAAECGTTYFLNSATEFQTTLPAISTVDAGCAFKFIVKAAPSGASYTIITGNSLENVLIGGINELEVDTADDGPYHAAGDTITLVDSLAAVGDYVELISDGTSFYLTGQTNLDGGATVAQAD